jgi:hypothetical protein
MGSQGAGFKPFASAQTLSRVSRYEVAILPMLASLKQNTGACFANVPWACWFTSSWPSERKIELYSTAS